MTRTLNKEHYNLFYIFQEDKENNTLSLDKAGLISQAIYKDSSIKFSYFTTDALNKETYNNSG